MHSPRDCSGASVLAARVALPGGGAGEGGRHEPVFGITRGSRPGGWRSNDAKEIAGQWRYTPAAGRAGRSIGRAAVARLAVLIPPVLRRCARAPSSWGGTCPWGCDCATTRIVRHRIAPTESNAACASGNGRANDGDGFRRTGARADGYASGYSELARGDARRTLEWAHRASTAAFFRGIARGACRRAAIASCIAIGSSCRVVARLRQSDSRSATATRTDPRIVAGGCRCTAVARMGFCAAAGAARRSTEGPSAAIGASCGAGPATGRCVAARIAGRGADTPVDPRLARRAARLRTEDPSAAIGACRRDSPAIRQYAAARVAARGADAPVDAWLAARGSHLRTIARTASRGHDRPLFRRDAAPVPCDVDRLHRR